MKLFKRNNYIQAAEVVYELKPGSYYVVEYQARAVSKALIEQLRQDLENANIFVAFVPNPTQFNVFQPMPAIPEEPQTK